MWIRLAGGVLRARILIVLLSLVLAVPAAYFALHIEPEEAFSDWFAADDPAIKTIDRFRDLFGNDELAIAVLSGGDVFSSDGLQALSVLTARLEKTPGVAEVTSLANVDHLRGEAGALIVEPLVPDWPPAATALASIRTRALGSALYRRILVSDEGRAAAVVAELEEFHTGSEEIAIVRNLQATVDEVADSVGRPVLLGGFPVLDAEILVASSTDARLFLYAAIPMIFLVLLALVRRVGRVVLTFLTVGLALLFTFGLFVATGQKFGILTSILPVLILGIGMANGVHVLVHYDEELALGYTRRRALAKTIRQMARPCLFTSITTAVGLCSFMVSDIPVVRMTGLYGALGVLIAFVLTITLLPALLSFLPAPLSAARARYQRGWLTGGLERLTRFDIRHRASILVAAVVILGFALWGLVRVSTETTWLHMLRESHPTRQVYEAVERAMAGSDNIEFLVEGAPGDLLEPERLRQIDRLAAFLAVQPGVSRVVSMVDYVKEINQALFANDAGAYEIPPTRAAVSQGLLLYEMAGGEELDRFASFDYATARVMALVETMSTREGKALREAVGAFARDPLRLDVVPTGHITVMGEMEEKVFRSQVRSLTVAVVLISLCMIVLLGSVRLGLASIIPNVLPIALMFGTMGFLAIPLDMTTVIVAGLALGIAVDDTIHYMTRVRRELEAGHTYEDAIGRANRTIARAVVATSVILCAGFLTLTLGAFEGSYYFGVLSALTMLYALVGDLVLLPAMLLTLRPIPVRHPHRPAAAPSSAVPTERSPCVDAGYGDAI